MPPAHASAGTMVAPVFDICVDGRRRNAQPHPDGSAEQPEKDGFGEELGADMAPGGAEGAAESDLRAALEHGDDHDVRDADRADQQGDGAEAEEQAVQRALGVRLGHQGVGGLADVDLAGVLRVGGRGQEVVHCGDPAVSGAEVDRWLGVAVEAEVAGFRAGGVPIRTEVSMSEASGAGLRIPAR